MLKISHRRTAIVIGGNLLLLLLWPAGSDCTAQIIFVGHCADCAPPKSSDFNDPNNWTFPDFFPDDNESFLIQDARTAEFSSGDTTLGGLTVANDSFGRLMMTGGSLTLLNEIEPLEVGRERFPRGKQGDYNNNGVVDAPDYTLWRDTLGDEVLNFGDGADGDESGFVDQGDYDFWKARFHLVTKGGEIIMTGTSSITTNGAAIGRRTKGLVHVGPDAMFDVKGPDPTPDDIRRKNLEVGNYGPAYIAITNEPGLEGDGLYIVEGSVKAHDLRINVFGATGEVRVLPGGNVNLNGALILSHCDTFFFPTGCGLIANPEPLMSSRLEIIGSGGTFTVGEHDPALSPTVTHKPENSRDIRSEFPENATISFTADAGGVTPIVLVDNSAFPGEVTGTAYLDGTVGNVPGTHAGINLELNLDSYTSSDPLTLIDAPPEHLVGEFGSVAFLGSRTATINYDYANGDVFLNNFLNGSGSAAVASSSVPEPPALVLATLTLTALLCTQSARFRRGSRQREARLISFPFSLRRTLHVDVL